MKKQLEIKKEIEIEIRSLKNEPKGASISLFTIDEKMFKEYFDNEEEYIKSSLFAFSLNLESKSEKDLESLRHDFESLKAIITEIPFYKKKPDKYDIIIKNKGTKFIIYLTSKEGKILELLLEVCMNVSEYIKFHFNLKTEVDFSELFQDNFSSVDYISNLFNVFVDVKLSGENLKYLQNSIIAVLNDLKVKKERVKNKWMKIMNVIAFFIGLKLKFEYDIETFKNIEYIKNTQQYISIAEDFINIMIRPMVEGMGFRNLFTSINFNCISFSFGIPKYQNGLTVEIKLPGMVQYLENLFK